MIGKEHVKEVFIMVFDNLLSSSCSKHMIFDDQTASFLWLPKNPVSKKEHVRISWLKCLRSSYFVFILSPSANFWPVSVNHWWFLSWYLFSCHLLNLEHRCTHYHSFFTCRTYLHWQRMGKLHLGSNGVPTKRNASLRHCLWDVFSTLILELIGYIITLTLIMQVLI